MLHHMEEQALEDYKVYRERNMLKVKPFEITMFPVQEKDISESRDFTAKLYNNEPLPGTEQYVDKQTNFQGAACLDISL